MNESYKYTIKLLRTLKSKFEQQINYPMAQIHHEIDLMIKRCE